MERESNRATNLLGMAREGCELNVHVIGNTAERWINANLSLISSRKINIKRGANSGALAKNITLMDQVLKAFVRWT